MDSVFYLKDSNDECICFRRLDHHCRICLTCQDQVPLERDDLNVSILLAFCMTHNFDTHQTLLALCPYNKYSLNRSNFFVIMLSNLSDLNGYMCDHWHREGDLCSSCKEKLGPSVFENACQSVNKHAVLSWVYFLSLEIVLPMLTFL